MLQLNGHVEAGGDGGGGGAAGIFLYVAPTVVLVNGVRDWDTCFLKWQHFIASPLENQSMKGVEMMKVNPAQS